MAVGWRLRLVLVSLHLPLFSSRIIRREIGFFPFRSHSQTDCSLDDALKLAVKVLSKTMDSTSLDHEKLEFATLTREDVLTELEFIPRCASLYSLV